MFCGHFRATLQSGRSLSFSTGQDLSYSSLPDRLAVTVKSHDTPQTPIAGASGHQATCFGGNCPMLEHLRAKFNITPVKSLAPYRECRGRKTSYKRKRIRAAALSIGAT